MSCDQKMLPPIIFGLASRIICFFIIYFTQNVNLERVKNCFELLKMLIESDSGKLVENTIICLTTFDYTSAAKKIIDLLGVLISVLKKKRLEVVNPHLYKRLKFKSRRNYYEKFYHHHYNIGSVFTGFNVESTRQETCYVSNLFMVGYFFCF